MTSDETAAYVNFLKSETEILSKFHYRNQKKMLEETDEEILKKHS